MSELTEMEKYLQKLFTQAGNDLKKKFLKHTQDFQRLDAERQQAVEDGRMTEDEYKEWRKNKLLYGMHWQRMIDKDTKELLRYNETALRYINGETPQIFASGYNSVVEKVPDSPVGGYDFELVNADTVKNIVHEEGIILPKKKLDPEKDVAWNAKLINAQLLQGILQGESIPEMAKRMQTVANSDLAGATRTARTMHTAAQNCGRQTGYNKAAKQGIIFEKTWLAANNERTRLSHSLMNGQTVAHDEKFVSPVTGVKLMFPGDWNAEGGDVGSEIYNCRCTLITKFKGFKKLNGEEPEPIQTHAQEKTTQQRSELSKGAKAIVKYFKKYFTEEQTERFTEMLTTNEAENRWFDNLKNQGTKWKKVASNCSWDGETIRWKLDDSPTKKEFTTIFHESGHAIDYFMGNGNYSANEIDKLVNLGCLDSLRANRRSTTDEFLAAMRKDKEALLSLLEKDADAVYKDLHVDNTYTNGIQDFIDGIYGYNNASLKICDWAHGEDYWNRANRFCRIMGKRVEAADYYNSVGIEVKNDEDLKRVMRDYDTATELWAHLNATYAYGGENYEIMNKYCPNAMKVFRKMMEEQP